MCSYPCTPQCFNMCYLHVDFSRYSFGEKFHDTCSWAAPSFLEYLQLGWCLLWISEEQPVLGWMPSALSECASASKKNCGSLHSLCVYVTGGESLSSRISAIAAQAAAILLLLIHMVDLSLCTPLPRQAHLAEWLSWAGSRKRAPSLSRCSPSVSWARLRAGELLLLLLARGRRRLRDGRRPMCSTEPRIAAAQKNAGTSFVLNGIRSAVVLTGRVRAASIKSQKPPPMDSGDPTRQSA